MVIKPTWTDIGDLNWTLKNHVKNSPYLSSLVTFYLYIRTISLIDKGTFSLTKPIYLIRLNTKQAIARSKPTPKQ